MPKPKKLKDIKVTFISLVQEGANQKQIIYKSADSNPTWQKEIPILKATEEGIVYGIVYSPGEVDTQGDTTTADEIKKAAYNFLKEKKTDAVDTGHSFKKVDAFVCESWIIKKGDPLFPNEKEGSWAVGIKLESEDLKKAVKEGRIKALSMAGVAQKEEIEKAELLSLDTVIELFKKLFNNTSMEIRGSFYQKSTNQEGDNLDKEQLKELSTIFKEALNNTLEPLKKEIKELKTQAEAQKEEIQKQKELLNKSSQQIILKTKKEQNQSESILA